MVEPSDAGDVADCKDGVVPPSEGLEVVEPSVWPALVEPLAVVVVEPSDAGVVVVLVG